MLGESVRFIPILRSLLNDGFYFDVTRNTGWYVFTVLFVIHCLTNLAMNLVDLRERYKNLDKRLKEAKELKKKIEVMELELQKSKCTNI